MTANMDRAVSLLRGAGISADAIVTSRVAAALAAAERRGEERVLQWMGRARASAWIDGAHRPVVSEYRKARRARVGRGRK